MKYKDGVAILDNSIYQLIYQEQPTDLKVYSQEIRAYKHPEIELFVIIQEFQEKVHFLKAYVSVHSSSKLVKHCYYGPIITHSYDNGQYHGLAIFMDGIIGINIQQFLDFLDKNINEFEHIMHSLPIMYLQLTAGSNTKKQETILKNLGLDKKNRDFYFSVTHAIAEERYKNTKKDFESDLE